MSKKGQPWDKAEEDKMLEALRRGEGLEAVARRHERTPTAIQWRLGTVFRRRMRSKPPASLEQLAVEFHQDEEAMRDILERLAPSSTNNSSDAIHAIKPKTDPELMAILEEINARSLKILRMVKKLQDKK
jgi:hypothetical protein